MSNTNEISVNVNTQLYRRIKSFGTKSAFEPGTISKANRSTLDQYNNVNIKEDTIYKVLTFNINAVDLKTTTKLPLDLPKGVLILNIGMSSVDNPIIGATPTYNLRIDDINDTTAMFTLSPSPTATSLNAGGVFDIINIATDPINSNYVFIQSTLANIVTSGIITVNVIYYSP